MSWDKHQQGRTYRERGYGTHWRKLREAVKRRDKGLCQMCSHARRIKAGSECDHIVPKAQGGTDDMSNLQWLCTLCHAKKTATERTGTSIHMGCDDSGLPVGRGHHWNAGDGGVRG